MVKKKIIKPVKLYLPYFQFAAVILTIALASHKIMEMLTAPKGPVLTWVVEETKIQDGQYDSDFRVDVAFYKYRNDCELTNWEPRITDSEGFLHVVATTIGTSAVDASDEKITRKFLARVLRPFLVSQGPAVFTGTLTYECPEGRQVIQYPKINFMITPPAKSGK